MSDLSSTGYGVDLGQTAQGWDTSGASNGITYYSQSAGSLIGNALSGTVNDLSFGNFLNTITNPTLGLSPTQGGQNLTDKLMGLPVQNAGIGAAGIGANGTTNFWSDLFLRSVVIILGFIFTAVGLSMFKSGGK